MKIFHDPTEIDTDWIEKQDNVDYGYKGDFSPVKILRLIEESINTNHNNEQKHSK